MVYAHEGETLSDHTNELTLLVLQSAVASSVMLRAGYPTTHNKDHNGLTCESAVIRSAVVGGNMEIKTIDRYNRIKSKLLEIGADLDYFRKREKRRLQSKREYDIKKELKK